MLSEQTGAEVGRAEAAQILVDQLVGQLAAQGMVTQGIDGTLTAKLALDAGRFTVNGKLVPLGL